MATNGLSTDPYIEEKVVSSYWQGDGILFNKRTYKGKEWKHILFIMKPNESLSKTAYSVDNKKIDYCRCIYKDEKISVNEARKKLLLKILEDIGRVFDFNNIDKSQIFYGDYKSGINQVYIYKMASFSNFIARYGGKLKGITFSGLLNDYGVVKENEGLKTTGYYLIESGGAISCAGINNIVAALKNSTGQDNARQAVLVKTRSSGAPYYENVYPSSGTTSRINIYNYIIENNLANKTSNEPTDPEDTGYEGSSGSIDIGGTSSAYNPGANGINLSDNSIGQVEYVNDFTRYKLVFKFGKDARNTDNFNPIESKAFIDTDDLIVRSNIKRDTLNLEMTLSDKYYSYSFIENIKYEPKEFFEYLDKILNLAIDDNKGKGKVWINNVAPILNLLHDKNESSDIEMRWENLPTKWKLVPMSGLAVKREWYNTLTNYISDTVTLEQAQTELTLDKCIEDAAAAPISLTRFYVDFDAEERSKYKFLLFDVFLDENKNIQSKVSPMRDFNEFLETINSIVKFAERRTLNCKMTFEQKQKAFNLYELKLFEAYTRGHDFIQEDYTTVRPNEQDKDGKRYMEFDDNYFSYKYSGRDFDIMNFSNEDKSKLFELPQSEGVYCALAHEKDLLTESDVTLGDAYGYKKYFVEAIKYYNSNTNSYEYKDTFKAKDYMDIVDSTKYTEDDIECITAKIDLTQCEYYNANKATAENGWCDCCYGNKDNYNKECIYQKLGYCPYRFQTEKHPRRIRTLTAEKSNRFNLIQELSKVFEIYPQFYIEFDNNGKVLLDEEGHMKKHVFFITEKGNKKNLGFRYEKNLQSITRTIDSNSITTKLYVADVDSELSPTGLCSIQTAVDNVGKTNYLLDFSYYTKQGLIDPVQITRDIYGLAKGDMAFLPTIGYYNSKYDSYTNLIINMTGETMTAAKAENTVNIESVTSCLEERQKIAQRMYQFKVKNISKGTKVDYTVSDTYKNYLTKFKEQSTIMWSAIEDLFFTNDHFNLVQITNTKDNEISYKFVDTLYGVENSINDSIEIQEQIKLINKYSIMYCRGELFFRLMTEGFDNEEYVAPFDSWESFREKIIDPLLYPKLGKLGQYQQMESQVKYWKLERSKWLNKINDLSEKFYKKYEPFIKEGTWTDNNYLTDNEYFWAANTVLSDSAKPKVTYDIKVIDISPIDSDYQFDLSDTSFVEDVDVFGINPKTGLPNQQKVIVDSLNDDLDDPTNNSLTVRNFTTSFDELFQSISASVQSLTFNENTYKRAANFTATKYISKESLQGTLFEGDLTLMNVNDDNVVINEEGAKGKEITNSSNQYKLTGEGLFFSKDGGVTWDIGVGPSGINADYIKFGQLDASKIQIVDGNYIYFLWDKSGISAYRNPATSTTGLVDFARFNKYGLSLIEKNKIRLRAGYEFKADDEYEGDYWGEKELQNQNVGFYLYNDTGKPIFKTETASLYNDDTTDYSARLSLTGEMFVTNKVLEGDNTGDIIAQEYEYIYTGGSYVNNYPVAVLNDNNNLTQIYLAFIDNPKKYVLLENITDENNIYQMGNEVYANINRAVQVTKNSPVYYYQNFDQTLLFKTVHESIDCYTMGYNRVTLWETIGEGETSRDAQLRLADKINKILNSSDPDKELNDLVQNNQKITTFYENIKIYKRIPEVGYELEPLYLPGRGESNPEEEIVTTVETDVTPETSEEPTQYDESKAKVYVGAEKFILTRQTHDPVATLTTYAKAEQKEYEVWDFEVFKEGKRVTDMVTKLKLYFTEKDSNDNYYSYWDVQELTGEKRAISSTSVKTNEVGIFINNKTSVNGGSQIVREYNQSNISQSSTEETESNNNSDTESENTSETETQTYVMGRATDTEAAASGNGIDIDSETFAIIGDSITVGLHNATPLDNRAVGVGSASMEPSRQEAVDMSPIYKENKIFKSVTNLGVFFGTNDIAAGYSKEQYLEYTKQTLERCFSANFKNNVPKIYMMSPIYGTFLNDFEKKYESFITVYKDVIKTLNEEKYLDTTYTFIDFYEKTKEISLGSDGIHPTGEGAKMLYNIIKDAFANTTINTETYKQQRESSVDIDEARETILAGAERVYMIALAGENTEGGIVYNNILSVLKNGCLYIGGTVNDFYGRPLKLSEFGKMPDEVRINDAKIIMSNNGYVWMNFKEVFAIDDKTGELSDVSLWELIGSGTGGSSSEEETPQDGFGLPAGYYLIDPIKD